MSELHNCPQNFLNFAIIFAAIFEYKTETNGVFWFHFDRNFSLKYILPRDWFMLWFLNAFVTKKIAKLHEQIEGWWSPGAPFFETFSVHWVLEAFWSSFDFLLAPIVRPFVQTAPSWRPWARYCYPRGSFFRLLMPQGFIFAHLPTNSRQKI